MNAIDAMNAIDDQDLVALAARLPDGLKQRGRTGKWVFKKAMEPYLPLEVIYR